MANITAKDFKDYIDDEFDNEILDLLIGVINQRKTFLSKMQDIGNPRMVVKGFQMNKQDLKEYVNEAAQIQKPISTPAELEQLKRDIEKTGLASHIGIETKRAHDNGGLINLYVDYEDPKHGTQELSIYLDLQGGGSTFNVRSEDGWSADDPVDAVNKILSKKSVLESIKKPTKRRKIIEATSQSLGSEVVLMLHEIASNYKVKVSANKSWSSVANMVESVYLSIAKKDRASFIKDIQKLKTGTRNGEIIL